VVGLKKKHRSNVIYK